MSTGTLGVNLERGKWLASLVLANSRGERSYGYAAQSGGAMTSTLMSLHPFARYRLNERTSLRGALGYGAGDLSLTSGSAAVVETDLASKMATIGSRGAVSAHIGSGGSFVLAIRSDALLTNTVSQETAGLMGAAGSTSRVRVLREGSGVLPLAWAGDLRPTLEVGLRYDGGDAETGGGLELGGGRLAVHVNARRLLWHKAGGYEESGFSGSIRCPTRDNAHGIALILGSAWGAAHSGVHGLWSRETAAELAQGLGMQTGQRYQAELSYGLSRRAALWVPFFAAESDAHSLRLGLRVSSGSDTYLGMELGRHEDITGKAGFLARIEGRLGR